MTIQIFAIKDNTNINATRLMGGVAAMTMFPVITCQQSGKRLRLKVCGGCTGRFFRFALLIQTAQRNLRRIPKTDSQTDRLTHVTTGNAKQKIYKYTKM